MKKILLFLVTIGIGSFLYANDIKVLKGKNKINYYGFPLFFAYGLNYRITDFEFFMPYIGFSFDTNPTPEFDATVGADFLYKKYFLSLSGFSELWNSEIIPFSKDTQFGGRMELGLLGVNSKLTLGSSVSQNRWVNNTFGKKSYFTLSEYIKLNLFLLSTAYCNSTANSKFTVFILPQNDFTSFEAEINIPFTINYCWGESCFLYSGFHTNILYEDSETKSFRITKKHNEITGRLNFSKDTKRYKNIHSLEFEQRIYPTKVFNYPLNLFFSVFGNIGVDFAEDSSLDFPWEVGGGCGYNLFGTVPFTFQAGINSDRNFIIYLGIVSKIYHNP